MILVLICVVVPLFVLGVIGFLRRQYGEELFNVPWPGQDLNRADDYRLIKLKLQDPEAGVNRDERDDRRDR